MHHQPFRNPSLLRALLAGCLLASLPLLTWADSIDELRALVDASDTTAAWSMAERMAPEHEGNPEFDFWFGLAAKAAGHRQQSALAFERVLLDNPDNPRARLELADAYFQLGNHAEARRLFEDVLATTPPEPVQEKIRLYLAALTAAEERKKTRTTGYITVAGGHDSNINNATADAIHLVTLPVFGLVPVMLPPSSLETDAAFMDLKAGVDVVAPANQRTIRFLSAYVQNRDNEDVFSGGNFDFTQASVTGGWLLRRGASTWRIPFNVQALSIESDESRYIGSAGLEYNRPLTASTTLLLFGQGGSMRFPSQDLRNAYMLMAGAGYVWTAPSSPLRVTTTLHGGSEPTVEREGDFNGRDYAALKLNLRYPLSASTVLYGGAGVQFSRYDDVHPVLQFRREERLVDASAGWQWQVNRDWNLNVDVLHASNASDGNSLYDYERTQVMLGSTWRF